MRMCVNCDGAQSDHDATHRRRIDLCTYEYILCIHIRTNGLALRTKGDFARTCICLCLNIYPKCAGARGKVAVHRDQISFCSTMLDNLGRTIICIQGTSRLRLTNRHHCRTQMHRLLVCYYLNIYIISGRVDCISSDSNLSLYAVNHI